MDILQKIFSLNVKCVSTAKIFMDRYHTMIEPSKDGKGINIYNPSTQRYSVIKKSEDIDYKLNLLYQIDGLKSFYRNNLSLDWISTLRNNLEKFLDSKESELILQLISLSKENSNLSTEIIKKKSKHELCKIIIYCIQEGMLKNKENFLIEWNWFYCNIAKFISDCYVSSFLKGSKESIYIDSLLNLYDDFRGFKHKNYKAFSDIRCLELFKENHKKLSNISPAISQHYNFKLLESNLSESEILSKIKFAVKIQSIEIISDLLNSVITDNLFETCIVPKGKKTEKYIKIKNAKLCYIIKDSLPSLNSEKSDYSKVLYDNFGNFLHKIQKNNKKDIHDNFYLETNITCEAKNILSKLKSKNPWCISTDLLYDFLCYFKQSQENLEFNFIKQVFNFDIESLDLSLVEKYDLIRWCYNLNDTNQNFYTKDFFISKATQKIKSIKISLYYSMVQACIMCCFPKFYYDWFFCPRGRIYVDNTGLSPQGSKIARFFIRPAIAPYKFKSNNLSLLEKTLFTLVEDIKKLEHLNIQELSNTNVWQKKPTEFFHLYSLLKDYKNKTAVRNIYALDATNSGIQMLGILQKNENFLEKCGAINKEQKFRGLYEKFGDFIKEKIIDFFKDAAKFKDIEFCFSFNSRAKNLKDEFSTLKAHLSELPCLEVEFDISKYNWIFSKRFYENFKQQKLSENVLVCLMIRELKKFLSNLKEIPNLENCLYDRKFAKRPIMTLPYNSTSRGRIDQMKEVYIESCFSKGIKFSEKNFKRLNFFFYCIDNIFVHWFDQELPNNKNLKQKLEVFIDSCLLNNKEIVFRSKYCEFRYSKKQQLSTRRKLGKKDSKGSKNRLTISYFLELPYNEIPIKMKEKYKTKILNSIVANIAHTLDKEIALDVVAKCLSEGIHVNTIHDCFRIEYQYADKLLDMISQAYINLYSRDLIKQLNIELGTPELPLDEFVTRLNRSYFVKE